MHPLLSQVDAYARHKRCPSPAEHQAQSRCAYLGVGTDATDWL